MVRATACVPEPRSHAASEPDLMRGMGLENASRVATVLQSYHPRAAVGLLDFRKAAGGSAREQLTGARHIGVHLLQQRFEAVVALHTAQAVREAHLDPLSVQITREVEQEGLHP